jgi:hypothetical protein
MMALFFVTKRNEYFPPGAYVKTAGMGMVRQLKVDSTGKPLGEEIGLAIPLKDVRGHMIRIQDSGFDDGR